MVGRIWGQTRYWAYRSGTFNVQRSTLNFQRGDRKGAWWPGYGDRHGFWGPAVQIEGQTRYLARTARLLTRRTRASAGLTVEICCDAQIWGQTRCSMYRSGTFNVQRSTFSGVAERAHGGRDMGTDTILGIPIGNVQRPTSNAQLSTR